VTALRNSAILKRAGNFTFPVQRATFRGRCIKARLRPLDQLTAAYLLCISQMDTNTAQTGFLTFPIAPVSLYPRERIIITRTFKQTRSSA
jgi:hypothetical protein